MLDVTEIARPRGARVRWVRERTDGRGADVVIEASGNPQAVREGLEMLRDAGRYVVVGQYTDAGDVTLNPHRHINRRHATVLGCWGYEYTHLHRSLLMMARHRERFGWSRLVTREYPLAEAVARARGHGGAGGREGAHPIGKGDLSRFIDGFRALRSNFG